MTFIGPKAEDADLWISFWEELNNFRSEELLIKVEHVTAHQAEEGAMLDGGGVAQARASTIHPVFANDPLQQYYTRIIRRKD